MSIRAVFFDMGGTIETFHYTREMRLKAVPGLRDCLATAGIHLTLNDEELLEVFTSGHKRYHSWRLQTLQELPVYQILREYTFKGYPIDPQALESIAEPVMFYFETRFYRREMRPEVPAVLEAVRSMGLKIGMISNVSSQGLVPANLKQYGIEEYFDPVVLSSVYGRRKPDPAIFHYAARLAAVPASQCLYIGDRIARDIVGARRAGFAMAVQIVHDFAHGEQDEGAQPDAVIHDLMELVGIIQAANSSSSGVGHPAATSKVRALLFDAGDILYFRTERSQLAAFLNDLSLSIEKDTFEERQSLSDQAYQGQITQDEYRAGILRLYGVNEPEQLERGKQILAEEDNAIHFFQWVPETLEALKEKGYLLGIITDTAHPVSVKLNWFEKGGFGHVWDTIISSQEMGIRKPNPEIYTAALTQLGVSAEEAVFVGHKTSELEGARAVGMKTVAFNYDVDAQADCYINSFSELLKLSFDFEG
jgi:putative hydrolase of the HAD superfamily